MIHHIEPLPQNLHGNFSRDIEPILTLESGDTVIAQTRCRSWRDGLPADPGTLPEAMNKDTGCDWESELELSLVGPIEIKGAKPGMVLEVRIEELKVGAYGLTQIGDHAADRCRISHSLRPNYLTWMLDSESGTAIASNGYKVRMRPFLGCIGVCPGQPGYHSNMVPRQVGGSMDCKELVAGTKLYLPIEVPGAMLSFGDGHAAQGDGEICGYALECPMDIVKLSVGLHDDMRLRGPVARTPDAWITFGFGSRSTDAVQHAVHSMLDIMVDELGVSRADAYMLASVAMDLRITQVANPHIGVHAIWHDNTRE